MAARNIREFKPIRETILIPSATNTGSGLDPTSLGLTGNLDNFIVGALSAISSFMLTIQKTSDPARAKAQESKTARIPQNELMDLIVSCFKEYRFWHLKDLRARLRQPENYLRDTLEIVAENIKSGPQSGTWQIKSDFRNLLDRNSMPEDPSRFTAAGNEAGFEDAGVATDSTRLQPSI